MSVKDDIFKLLNDRRRGMTNKLFIRIFPSVFSYFSIVKSYAAPLGMDSLYHCDILTQLNWRMLKESDLLKHISMWSMFPHRDLACLCLWKGYVYRAIRGSEIEKPCRVSIRSCQPVSTNVTRTLGDVVLDCREGVQGAGSCEDGNEPLWLIQGGGGGRERSSGEAEVSVACRGRNCTWGISSLPRKELYLRYQ
jgi:hypothetical protein